MARPKTGAERRKKQRIQLTRGIIARLGTLGVVILDITDAGARIEHFTRLDVGKRARFRFEWEDKDIQTEAVVVSCKLHRFAHGDDGATVYQSGIFFAEYVGDSNVVLREMVAKLVARSLAEQVANARGIGPVIERNMPVFRSGVVAASGFDASQVNAQRFIPDTELMVDRGYVRCSLVAGRRFEKKWSRSPEQPEEGFTILATESPEHVDQLCETYLQAGAQERELIRALARLSVEKSQETPEPKG
jgi:hypothetical protein